MVQAMNGLDMVIFPKLTLVAQAQRRRKITFTYWPSEIICGINN